MNLDVRCGRACKSLSVYLISMFCSCSSVKLKKKIVKLTKTSPTPRPKFIDVLYYKHEITLMLCSWID